MALLLPLPPLCRRRCADLYKLTAPPRLPQHMTLAHVRRGSGPPLVLIHGIGSQWQMWEPVLSRLEREREVVALDLPGFGDSEEHRARPTIEALADAVAEFLDGIGFAGAHVAGNSLGGGVALMLARIGAARSACVLSPTGFVSGREGDYARALLMGSRRAAKLSAERAELLSAGPVRRTLGFWHLCARPWRGAPGGAAGAVGHPPPPPGGAAALDPGGGLPLRRPGPPPPVP